MNPLIKFFVILLIATLILAAIPTCKGQIKADFGAGLIYKSELHPMAKISFGYELYKVNIETVFQPTISRDANTPLYTGIKAGYNINGLIPMIGYYYRYASGDDKRQNGWVGLGYSIKYVYLLGDQGGLFAEAAYINESVSVITGFHVIF